MLIRNDAALVPTCLTSTGSVWIWSDNDVLVFSGSSVFHTKQFGQTTKPRGGSHDIIKPQVENEFVHFARQKSKNGSLFSFTADMCQHPEASRFLAEMKQKAAMKRSVNQPVCNCVQSVVARASR